MVLFAVEASAVSSGRPCGVYMFSGLTTQVFYIIMLQKEKKRWIHHLKYECGLENKNSVSVILYWQHLTQTCKWLMLISAEKNINVLKQP